MSIRDKKLLTRYWFRFDADLASSLVCERQCGVTAYSVDDAIALMSKYVFIDRDVPKKFEIEVDIDVSRLDPNHILPNSGDCSVRGVWYPNVGPS